MAKKSKPPGDDATPNPAPEPEPTPEPTETPAPELAPIAASETFPAPADEPAPAVVATLPVDTYSAERLSELIDLAKETSKLQGRYLRSADQTKRLKKEWEAALDKEHRFTLNSEQRPFKLGEPVDLPTITAPDDEPEDDESTPDAEAAPKPKKPAKRKPVASSAPADDESWKVVALSNLGIEPELSPAILKALGAAELLTAWDLILWTEPRPRGKGLRLTDIPGIGETKATAIEEALIAFWAARAKAAAEPEPAAPEPRDPRLEWLASVDGIPSSAVVTLTERGIQTVGEFQERYPPEKGELIEGLDRDTTFEVRRAVQSLLDRSH